jgi:hypothetical protein
VNLSRICGRGRGSPAPPRQWGIPGDSLGSRRRCRGGPRAGRGEPLQEERGGHRAGLRPGVGSFLISATSLSRHLRTASRAEAPQRIALGLRGALDIGSQVLVVG